MFVSNRYLVEPMDDAVRYVA